MGDHHLDLDPIKERVRAAGAISRTFLALPPETLPESVQFIARAQASAMDVPALVDEVGRLRRQVTAQRITNRLKQMTIDFLRSDPTTAEREAQNDAYIDAVTERGMAEAYADDLKARVVELEDAVRKALAHHLPAHARNYVDARRVLTDALTPGGGRA